VAELAGISESYLSRIERGERPVDRRSLLEPLAAALEVAPGELTGVYELIAAEGMGAAHAAVVALRVALADNALDDPADDVRWPWSELVAILHLVNSQLRPTADYAAMGVVVTRPVPPLHSGRMSRARTPAQRP
jgi:transcriptional regulator with XRE-family HTH domain